MLCGRKRPVDIVISHETVFNTRAQENTLEKIVEQGEYCFMQNEYHVKKALEETEKLYFWLKTIIEHI